MEQARIKIPLSKKQLQLLKGKIAIWVPELFLETQFHPLTFKTAVLVLKLYF